nr:MAG TPA: hypothetical protein [Caudoviricetes sp.]DAS26260.1 MAG TPA: hypothetical protein [Caudoviricetes sp.]
MKNNNVRTGSTPQLPIHSALMQAHSSVYRAMADIRLAAKIVRKQHDEHQEPNNLEKHSRLDELMQEMLFDIQRLIGRDAIRSFTNTARHE